MDQDNIDPLGSLYQYNRLQ